jgi:hypothetical protein
MKFALLVALIIFLVILGPVLIIWSLNVLFPTLAIPYTWETWLAVVFIGSLFKTTVKVSK